MRQVKICCLVADEEVDAAVAAGAQIVGVVSSAAPRTPRVTDDTALRLLGRVPHGVSAVVLTPLTDADALLARHGDQPWHGVQLVAATPIEALRALRRARPRWRLLQAVHMRGEASLARAEAVAPWVDDLVLDSGDSGAGRFGGTGVVHDWSLSRRLRDALPDTRLWLAGGLSAANVAAAIRAVAPDGVDVCSGVRRNGRLSDTALARFMAQVAAAG